MTITKLPLFTDVFYNYTVSLESRKYILSFIWNDRDNSWRMSIKLDDQTPVVLGYKLVSSYPMMADYSLETYGLNGYFILAPKSVEVGLLSLDPNNMYQYYDLFYISP